MNQEQVDNDNSSYEGVEDIPLSARLRRRRPTGAIEEELGNSARKKAKSGVAGSAVVGGVQNRLPTNAKQVSALLTHLKKRLVNKEYDRVSSDRVVHAALKLQLEHCKDRVKKPGVRPPPPKVRETVCDLFGLSSTTYTKIMGEYFNGDRKKSYVSGQKGNKAPKGTIVPQTKAVVVSIRSFVRDRRSKKERTTAVQVLEHCQSAGFIDPILPENPHYKKTYDAALRAVQRWLSRNQYRRPKDWKDCDESPHCCKKRCISNQILCKQSASTDRKTSRGLFG
jgi:hypothetical protein